MRRTAVLFSFILATWFIVIPQARADPWRVFIELAPADDELARATALRFGAELSAAGFGLANAPADSDVHATLVVREGRLRLFLELPGGDTLVVRADDVPPAEAPPILALRAVERLNAVASMPLVSAAPPQKKDPPPPKNVNPRRPSVPIGLFVRRHVDAGVFVSFDGGAPAIAPTIGLGLGMGRGFFVRGSFWGPSSSRTYENIAGSVDISALGARLDLGKAWLVHPRLEIGATLGLGFTRYAIEGRANTGFSARSEAQAVFVTRAGGFLAWRITTPLYAYFDAGAALSIPAVGITLAEIEVAEFGAPEVNSTIGLGWAF